jgi:hypothetical protein
MVEFGVSGFRPQRSVGSPRRGSAEWRSANAPFESANKKLAYCVANCALLSRRR